MRKYNGNHISGVRKVTSKILITCRLKLFVLLIISFVVRMIATTRKKIRKIPAIFIQRATPWVPNNEDKLHVDLSSTTPTHVPMITNLQYKFGTWDMGLGLWSSILVPYPLFLVPQSMLFSFLSPLTNHHIFSSY